MFQLTFALQSASGIANLIFPLLLLAFFYFFFMRPQMTKQKEQASFIGSIQKGDEVVTSSGIIGRINKIDANEYTLELEKGVFVRVIPQAISKEMTDLYRANQKA
jgi:preprotein translocase subunit YajC